MEKLFGIVVLAMCICIVTPIVKGEYTFEKGYFEVPVICHSCTHSWYEWVHFWYKLNKFQVDHFSFTTDKKFKIKYLYNETHWNKKENGPIFFYTGNEGAIELFAQNTGFMWDIAQEFGALVLFAEHRYYGESLPFGNMSFTVNLIHSWMLIMWVYVL